MIQIIDGELTLGGKTILTQINWRIDTQQRIGLVGANGSGKSSLLRVLMSEYALDKGSVECARRADIAYLPQDSAELPRQRVKEVVWQAFHTINAIEEEMKTRLQESETLPADSPQQQKALKRYGELQEAFQEQGGYQREADAKKVLLGLGFQLEDWERPVAEFSGGWRMRVLLARLLLQKPDILLLDEPTNHLDPPSLAWLEQYLLSQNSGLVIVSHDRYFLDRVVNEIAEIELKKLHFYKGNYSEYRQQKEERREQLLAAKRNQDKERAHLQQFVDRFRAKATKASQAQSRLKRLEKMETIEIEEEHRQVSIPMPETPRSGKEVISLDGVGHCYGENRALYPVDATLYRGDRIAVWGKNGAGKSTLLAIMAKSLQPSEGEVQWGHRVHPAYFSQQHAELQESPHSVYDELSNVAPPEMQSKLRDVLGAFLFQGDDVQKPVTVLSGGEKSRLALAKLLVHPCNLLIMDEPLNHLDMQTVETLESTLQSFEGTLIFVSHDRFFADRLATHIWEMEAGRLRIYPGNFQDYQYSKSLEEPPAEPSGNGAASQTDETEKTTKRQNRKEQKRIEAEERNRLSAIRREKEKQYESIETEIFEVESEIDELEQILGSGELVHQPEEMASASKRYKALLERKDILYAQWESLVETLEHQ